MASQIQSLIFDRTVFLTVGSARKWALDHGFSAGKVDPTANTYRIRQQAPDFPAYRTKPLRSGVKAVLGLPDGVAERCGICSRTLAHSSPEPAPPDRRGPHTGLEFFPGSPEESSEPAGKGGLLLLSHEDARLRATVYQEALSNPRPSEDPEVADYLRARARKRGPGTSTYPDRTHARTLAGRLAYGDLPRIQPRDLPDLDLTYQIEIDRNGIPMIRVQNTVILPVSNLGYPLVADGGWTGTRLLTLTHKLAAPSFSLPAGTLASGGSCVAANLRGPPPDPADPSGAPTEPAELGAAGVPVCARCYALGGNYLFDLVATPAILRQAWVLGTLGADPAGGSVADGLISAIRAFATHPDPDVRNRASALIGRASGTDLVLPSGLRIPTRQGRLGPDGEIAGYFRIHDAGDFSPGTSPALWTSYVHAWIRVVDSFPYVRFWAPTRAWAVRETPKLAPYHQALRDLAARPNVTLRPSAIRVGDPPPKPVGFAAGAGVYPSKEEAPSGVYACPVYTENAPSCQEAGCRACWDHPKQSIWYRLHR